MRGRRKTLKISEAEWSIMKVLWDGCEACGRGMTLGEIVQCLAEPTDWSNTTIRTLIVRLAEKGAVTIDKRTGVYKYTPKTAKADCIKKEVEFFVDRVFDGSAADLVKFILDSDKLNEAEIIEFSKLFRMAAPKEM